MGSAPSGMESASRSWDGKAAGLSACRTSVMPRAAAKSPTRSSARSSAASAAAVARPFAGDARAGGLHQALKLGMILPITIERSLQAVIDPSRCLSG